MNENMSLCDRLCHFNIIFIATLSLLGTGKGRMVQKKTDLPWCARLCKTFVPVFIELLGLLLLDVCS